MQDDNRDLNNLPPRIGICILARTISGDGKTIIGAIKKGRRRGRAGTHIIFICVRVPSGISRKNSSRRYRFGGENPDTGGKRGFYDPEDGGENV